MKHHRLARGLLVAFWLCLLPLVAGAGESDPFPVKITANLPFVDLPGIHQGKDVRLQRDQNPDSVIDFDFSFISRACPPFCIQPMTLSPGVETIAELEVIDVVKRIAQKDNSVLLIDSRTEEWLKKGMIPGALSIPWTKLHYKHTDKETLTDILLMQFGVSKEDDLLSFQDAKTLVFYCNGNWCGQSPTSIRSLLMLGYPPHKLKWYRDGMQAWMMLGLTTVNPPEVAAPPAAKKDAPLDNTHAGQQ
ncbi:MAG: rhodanese-like domain-containing protein [Magnetococcales bacterium]|nr:rhodanese-like domain-containing protein [Magnetococcales bacterium]